MDWDRWKRIFWWGAGVWLFAVSKYSSTTFLYSNDDIQRFGQILASRPKTEPVPSRPASTTAQVNQTQAWGSVRESGKPPVQSEKWRFDGSKLVYNYELSQLPPQTTTSLKIECTVSRYLNGKLGTHLRFNLTPYLYLLPGKKAFEAHLVKAPFVLGLVADGSGKGTEASPLVQGGMFEVNASAYEETPDTVCLGIISSRDTMLAARTLALGKDLTLTLIDYDSEPPVRLRLRLPGDDNFASLYDRLQRSV